MVDESRVRIAETIELRDGELWIDGKPFGPCEGVPVRLTAAALVAAWAMRPGRKPFERRACYRFLTGWPEGPQIPVPVASRRPPRRKRTPQGVVVRPVQTVE